MRRLQTIAPPLIVLAVGVLVWELLVRWLEPRQFVFCGPVDVWREALERSSMLARATLMTTLSVLIGFLAALAFGLAAAVALSSSRWLERAFYPFTVILQTVPLVAIAPMLVIWLDAGIPAVATCAFIVCLFPVITNALDGIRAIPSEQRELFLLHRAGYLSVLFKLLLPGALPSIMTGLRIASGLAVIGAVVGEFVAGELGDDRGLGIVIMVAAKQGELPLLFAAVILASLLGIAMLAAVGVAAHLFLHRWHVAHRDPG